MVAKLDTHSKMKVLKGYSSDANVLRIMRIIGLRVPSLINTVIHYNRITRLKLNNRTEKNVKRNAKLMTVHSSLQEKRQHLNAEKIGSGLTANRNSTVKVQRA